MITKWSKTTRLRDETRKEVELACKAEAFDKAVSVLSPIAGQGDAEAQYLLGNLYFEGADMEEAEAQRWLEAAAEQDYADAILLLSHFHPTQYLELVSRAAELGSIRAHSELGGYYATGDWGSNPDESDDEKSVFHYTQAANAGDKDAQYNLGTMILFGEGCLQDTAQAIQWLSKAGKSGQLDAIRVMAELYEKGVHGVKADKKTAAYWKALLDQE